MNQAFNPDTFGDTSSEASEISADLNEARRRLWDFLARHGTVENVKREGGKNDGLARPMELDPECLRLMHRRGDLEVNPPLVEKPRARNAFLNNLKQALKGTRWSVSICGSGQQPPSVPGKSAQEGLKITIFRLVESQ